MYFTTFDDTHKNIVRGLQSLQNITRGTLVSTIFNFPCELLCLTTGGREWHKLKPFGVLYYLEYIESMHTPSWKRRIHGCSSIVLAEEIKGIHKALANLIYMDTVDEIKSGLLGKGSTHKCTMSRETHYIALKKYHTTSCFQDHLDVLLVIRGTADFKDVLSDTLLDAVDFRQGKGHSGLAASGQFLVDHHRDLIQVCLSCQTRHESS